MKYESNAVNKYYEARYLMQSDRLSTKCMKRYMINSNAINYYENSWAEYDCDD